MDYLPESTNLLYSQLLSQCLQGAAPSGRGLTFVHKTIKGGKHWYLQLTVGNRKTQHYIGPDNDAVRDVIGREKANWEKAAPDVAQRTQLVSMLIAGGAATVGPMEARVLGLLERAGVFLVGGVLVGSYAMTAYSSMLGVRWDTELMQTHDVDIASYPHMEIGISESPAELKAALMASEMGFIEVPALDPKSPSTRFRIRGRELSVDVLTPMTGKPDSSPIEITALSTYAEPVRFLDFVLEEAQPAVVIANAGILVNVATPARYALHKLVVSQRRGTAMHTKKQKDVRQAAELLNVLLEDRPGDIQRAWQAATEQETKFMTQLKAGVKTLPADLQNSFYKLVG